MLSWSFTLDSIIEDKRLNMALASNEMERARLENSSKGKGRETRQSSSMLFASDKIVSCHVAARHIMGTLNDTDTWKSEKVSEYSLCLCIQYLPISTSCGNQSV